MAKLTKEQKKNYLASKGSECPHCNSTNITSIEHPQADSGEMTQEIECEDCGEAWKDVYQLSGVEDIYD